MPQEINDALLDKLLHMARLALSQKSRAEMKQELNRMTEWLKKLQEVDVQGVTPLTTMTTEVNQLREDVPEDPLPLHRALYNAPDRSSHYFRTLSVQKK